MLFNIWYEDKARHKEGHMTLDAPSKDEAENEAKRLMKPYYKITILKVEAVEEAVAA